MSDYTEIVGMTRLILGSIDYSREGADSKGQYLQRYATEVLPQFASQVGFASEPATLEWLQPFIDYLLTSKLVHWTQADNRWRNLRAVIKGVRPMDRRPRAWLSPV